MARPGEEAWKENSTPFERVRSVVLAVSEPRSADYVANEAAVSEETATSHLDSLVDLTVVLEHDVGDQTKYGPDPLYTRFQTIRDLLDAHDRDGLTEIRDELRDQIETWRSEYSVDSPDALRDRAAERESSPASEEPHQVTHEWELVEHRLSLITDAINLS